MSSGESPEHKAMVISLMKYLNQQGFETIGAECNGFKQCGPIDGEIADFIGKNSQGLWCIGEAKTCDDLVKNRESINNQFRAFSSRQATFYISVPAECNEQLFQILRESGLLGKSNVITLQYR